MHYIVINACYGGFSLSHACMLAYASNKGIDVWHEVNPRYVGEYTYWTVPPYDRLHELTDGEWGAMSHEQRRARNVRRESEQLSVFGITRDDPALVAAVRQLGSAKASGKYAQLAVVGIPDDVQWCIEDYDGQEWIAEIHRTWHAGDDE